MTPEQVNDLTEIIIETARRTHSGEVSFAEFCGFVREELKQLENSNE